MDKVYIVTVGYGSYDSYNVSNVCAFLTKENAEKECARLEEDLERLKRAHKAKQNHMREWTEANPFPGIEMKYSTDKLKEYKEYGDLYAQEAASFLNKLNYITEDEKQKLATNYGYPADLLEDGDYVVEELELRN